MSAELLKQHGKKVAGTAATGSVAGVVAWALMTFTPITDHKETRREVQALREATGPMLWDYENGRLTCSCGKLGLFDNKPSEQTAKPNP